MTKTERVFIPAQRKSDGVVGLYELPAGIFRTRQGTRPFIAGPVADEC